MPSARIEINDDYNGQELLFIVAPARGARIETLEMEAILFDQIYRTLIECADRNKTNQE